MQEVVIVEAVRTPIGRRNGQLSGWLPVELAAATLQEVTRRAGVEPGLVEDVVMGCVTQTGEQGANIGRLAVLLAGFPVTVPSVSLNRMCGSSQQAIHFAAQAIAAGDMDLVIAAGVESMSRVPMGSDFPGSFPAEMPYDLVPQGISAELIAQKWRLTREGLDAFSVDSHLKADAASSEGYFAREILPLQARTLDGKRGSLATSDEGIRPQPDRAKIAALPPAFKLDGMVTAANSSQISDGAAAVLLASAETAEKLGLKARARIVARVVVGDDPVLMLTGVIPATRKVLARAGLRTQDIDLFEINEAFAAMVLSWIHDVQPDLHKVNVNGGAIALGHPLGASGARIMTTLLHELERRQARYGLQTMCIGHGMATATVIERL